ncbi:MAG: hypothetical protein C0418_03640 [Coriobacteriaceae bacterium]|nr:hypothetical protein [Coriobacteriaceae bacterium]
MSGIKAARVVVSPEGTILEVHVLALPTKSPKQIVRDVESTVMAGFGIPVDHRKISIAQLGAEAMPKEEEPAEGGRARIHAVDESVSGVHASARVTIELEEELYVGEASGPASETGRRRIIAEAALEAVQHYAHGALTFGLEDVSVVQLGRERVAVACVTLVTPMGEQAFSGSALVRQNEKDSIVRATLDAINRRLHLLTSA